MRVYKRGRRWWLDFRWGDKRYRRPVAETRKLAEEIGGRFQVQIAEGTFNPHASEENRARQRSFGELCAEFLRLSEARNTPSTTAFYRLTTVKLLAFFGEARVLEAISPRDCELFEAARRREVAAATANRSVYVLAALFRKAVKWGWVARNPAENLGRVREEGRERFLTPGEAEAVLRHYEPGLRPVIEMFLYTGARRGDLLGGSHGWSALTWADVDLDHGVIAFRETKEKRVRHVPICADLVSILRDLPSRFQGGVVFLDEGGKPLKPERALTGFKRAAAAAGVADSRTLRLHDLRHTAASWMVQRGVPLFDVGRVLGHQSIAMTERYAHMAPEHLTGAVSALGDTLRGSVRKRVGTN